MERGDGFHAGSVTVQKQRACEGAAGPGQQRAVAGGEELLLHRAGEGRQLPGRLVQNLAGNLIPFNGGLLYERCKRGDAIPGGRVEEVEKVIRRGGSGGLGQPFEELSVRPPALFVT